MSHVDETQLICFLDGELEPDAASRVEAHLDSCDACQVRATEERRVRARAATILAGASPTTITPPPFEELRNRATALGSRRKTAQLSALRPVAWAATIVVAVGVGWYVRGQRTPSDSLAAGSAADTAPPTLALAEQDRMMEPDENRAVRLEQTDRPTEASPADAAEEPPVSLTVPTPTRLGRARNAQEDPQTVAHKGARGFRQSETLIDQLSVATPLADSNLIIRGLRDDWTATDRTRAQVFLGGQVAIVDELEIVAFEVRDVSSGRMVRVTQRLPSGDLVQLVQQSNAEHEEIQRPAARRAFTDALAARGGITALTEVRGNYLITLQAPIPADSLRALFKRVK